jgi:hypothetical protein
VVPAQKGVAFGISFRIDGVKSWPLRITQTITSPPLRKPSGTVLTTQVSYQDAVGRFGTVLGKVFYTLREDYEVVPGEWTITVGVGSSRLVEQRLFVRTSHQDTRAAPPNVSLQATAPG